MTIYATGTSGYIGSKLKNSIPLEIELSDEKTFARCSIFSSSTVIHLAAIVGVQQVLEDPVLAQKVNVDGTLNFAEYLMKNTDSRFIFVSSSHVYKASNNRHTEISPLEPMSLYAEMKVETEKRLKETFSNEPQRLLIARVFSILGGNMPPGTLGWTIERATTEKPVKNSDDLRDFSTAEETANLLESLAVANWLSTTINVCSGTCRSVREAGRALRRELDLGDDDNVFLAGHSSVPRTCGDNSLLVKTFSRSL